MTAMLNPERSITLTALLLLLAAPVLGQNTERWRSHDSARPHPPVVTPAPFENPMAPPADAIVLFDGSDLSEWRHADGSAVRWQVRDGYFEVAAGSGDIYTHRTFGDVQLHIEWAAPPDVTGSGQDRANSGVFFMNQPVPDGAPISYEIQVLDSYQSETYADGQAAAVYGQRPPLVNAMRPPGEWQTYDIVFRRPRFDVHGDLLEPARVTVFHNGVLVQDSTPFEGPTMWLEPVPYEPHPDRLPLGLQDHGEPVRFRNIWVRELREHPEPPPPPQTESVMWMMPDELDRYTGRYTGETTDFFVEREGTVLQMRFPWRPGSLDLIPISEREFAMRNTDGRLVFDLGADGVPTGVTFHMAGARPAAKVE